MQEGRRIGDLMARDDLQAARRHIERRQQRLNIGLHIVEASFCRTRPVAADSARRSKATTQPGSTVALVALARAAKHLSDLEQRDILNAAIRIALRGHDEPRHQARTHIGKIRRDRVGEAQLGLAAAESLRRALRDKRPRHCLDHAAQGQRPLGEPRALLKDGEHGLVHLVDAQDRREWHIIDADNACDFLDDIGLALNIRTPMTAPPPSPPGPDPDIQKPSAPRIAFISTTGTSSPVRRLTSEIGKSTIFSPDAPRRKG